jgi:hypothetical protein
MSHQLARYYGPRPVPRTRSGAWPKPKERRLELSPSPHPIAAGDWGGVQAAPECQVSSAEISEGYKSAIALLRSLRNVSEAEAQEKRESWELLSQALDEDKYH